jgi:hypothetical protein
MRLLARTVVFASASFVVLLGSCGSPVPKTTVSAVKLDRAQVAEPSMPIAFGPLGYRCVRTAEPPAFDGRLEHGAWANAAWTRLFEDIEGPLAASPTARTRAKMLWDESFLYIAAILEETDLWATYQRHDMIVFHENDFEVFIDPDGDGREYYEIEINVLGTVFDLFLHRPYRENGPAEHGWDAEGMRCSITVHGSINDPSDRDQGWIVELAVPWSDLAPPTRMADGSPWTLAPLREHLRGATPPALGDVWRLNFSRVQWDLEVVDDAYQKIEGRSESNWTWTPQWEINMHVPEHWGFVEFLEEEAMDP